MSRVLIRHGLSEANNRNNFGNLAFANADAPLMTEGVDQARAAGGLIACRYSTSIFDMPVAVSTMRRTQDTATTMGFNNQQVHPELSEVTHEMSLTDLRKTLDQERLPAAAIIAAERILEQPPLEGIWITHGLVIAGLCSVLGVKHEDWRLIPRFCEIRELPII